MTSVQSSLRGSHQLKKPDLIADHASKSPHLPDIEDTVDFGPKVFALLIAIDEYSQVHNLNGCVNDCKDVEAWLRESFGLIHAVRLLNEEASREGILNAVANIATDSRIEEDDLIFIYYAGHGGQLDPLKEWNVSSTRKVQMLIPYDFSPSGYNHILDRELSQLISKVAHEKGDNIIVVLDSCHSASGTRDDGAVRSVNLPGNYAELASLDTTDFASDTRLNCSRAASTTPMDHILLAACREDLKAKEFHSERGRRGVFTYNLFRKLREKSSKSLTYEELILSLSDMQNQFPHCDGINKDRFIFSRDRKDPIFQSIEVVRGDIHHLQLGLCHDVQQNDRFLIFEQQEFSSAYVGEAEVVVSHNFDSHLRVPPRTPSRAFAVRAVWDSLVRVFSLPSEVQGTVAQYGWFQKMGVQLVDNKNTDTKSGDNKTANLDAILGAQNWVKLKHLDPEPGLVETFFHPWPLEAVNWVRLVQGIGHFYHYLNRIEPSQNPSVEIALVTVKDGKAIGNPYRLKSDQGVPIPADDETEYGFQITNNSNQPIFFSLFYFDMSTFSIVALYNPPTVAGGEATPCLVGHESKTVGYGNEADDPFIFNLTENQMKDVGYLKLFYSDRYLNLLHIKREDLFLPEDKYSDLRALGRKSTRTQQPIPRIYMPNDSSARYLAAVKIPIVQVKPSSF